MLVPLLAAAGCGGDDSGSDEDAIREAIRLSLTTDDPKGDCNERLSDSLIQRSYGSRARCEQIQKENAGNSADSVEFAGVTVEGDAATAEIEARGGEVGRVEGVLEVKREDGDWRIDDISVPLLRRLVELGLEQTENIPAGGPECMAEELRGVPDAEFRDFAYQLIGQAPESQRRIFELLAACKGEGGVSLLRLAFEEGITGSLRENDATQEQIDCVVSSVRERLGDDRLLELLGRPDANETAGRIVAPVLQECGAG